MATAEVVRRRASAIREGPQTHRVFIAVVGASTGGSRRWGLWRRRLPANRCRNNQRWSHATWTGCDVELVGTGVVRVLLAGRGPDFDFSVAVKRGALCRIENDPVDQLRRDGDIH